MYSPRATKHMITISASAINWFADFKDPFGSTVDAVRTAETAGCPLHVRRMRRSPGSISQSLGFLTQSLLVLLLLTSCRASKPDDSKVSSSSGDTLGRSASGGRDTSATAEKALSPRPAESGDTAGIFDPDGYYLLKGLTINGRNVSWLELQAQPPEVTVSLSIPGSTKHSRHPCAAPLISPDTLSVRCVGTPVGDLTINGHFLDKSGSYSDKLAYENEPTVLLVARVVVTSDGRIIHDAVHRFTYSAGD